MDQDPDNKDKTTVRNLTKEDIDCFVRFFSILIEEDQRIKAKNKENKSETEKAQI